MAVIAPTACHRGPVLHVSRQHHVPASRQQLLATAATPRRSVPSTKQVLEIGGLFSACTLLSLLSDTLTKKILQRDRSLLITPGPGTTSVERRCWGGPRDGAGGRGVVWVSEWRM